MLEKIDREQESVYLTFIPVLILSQEENKKKKEISTYHATNTP